MFDLIREATLLAVILLLSATLQAVAAFMALKQVPTVDGPYRLAWFIVSLALVLMVERRMVPLWRLIHIDEVSSLMDAWFGLAISALMVAGVYGVTELVTGLKSLADTDMLTGLASRAAVLRQAQYEIDRSLRTKHPVAFLMFDLDHFKLVNDTHGHLAGDVVLRSVADIARATFRHIDFVGRIGGEEFLAILPDNDQGQAMAAAERFRSAIATHEFELGKAQISITLSIGVVVPGTAATSLTAHEVMNAADKALYAAKKGGRNRVVVM
jgi:diguanylate cyclase (GGDEF)-like protein